MQSFKDLYLSSTPITETYLNRFIAGQETTNDGRTKNTPLLEIKNLMVDALKEIFKQCDQTGKFSLPLTPRNVFGVDENGENNYNEVARYIVISVIEFLNDQYGDYGKNGFDSMFNKIFTTPIKTNKGTKYLRIHKDAIYKRTYKQVHELFEEANYQLPLTYKQREKFKQIYRNAYYSLIEGVIAYKKNEPATTNYGKHIIVQKSDMQVALKMINENKLNYNNQFNDTIIKD